MDQIDIVSSEDSNQVYSELSFVEETVIQHQEEYHLLYDQEITLEKQEKPPTSKQQPTYQEIMNIIQTIRSKYSQRFLQQIVDRLYKKRFPTQQSQATRHKIVFGSQGQKHRYFMQCKYAAKAFVQFQYGINRMRKLLSRDNVHLQISVNQYNNVINRIYYSSFKRLEDFINKKVQSQENPSKEHRGILCKIGMRGLIQAIKYCRKILSSQDIHVLFKIITSTANNQRLRLSKRQALGLYNSLIRFIRTKRRRGEGQLKYLSSIHLEDSPLNIQEQQLINQLDFNQQKLHSFLDLYIQQPNSLFNITKILKSIYPALQGNQLFKQSFLKLQLQNVILQTIKRIREESQRPEIVQRGATFKKLVHLDEQNTKLIKQSPEAGYLRSTICQYYKAANFDINALICTILQINEFINKKEHDKIIQNLRLSKEVNSICREEYEFAGKRRKVLIFKRKKKPKRKPNYY